MKKPDFFNKAVAEKLGIPLTTVKKINSFFWRVGVKQPLSEARHNAIFIKNFGTITVSPYKLYRDIQENIQRIRTLRASVFYTDTKRNQIMEVLYRELRQLLTRRDEIARRNYEK